MELGFYAAAALLNAQEKQFEITARNINESNQAGSKHTITDVSGVDSGQVSIPGGFEDFLQGVMPSVKTQVNFQQGLIRPSGNPYDIAISGEGFFQVDLPNGQAVYTRNGNFHVSPDYQLIDGYGRAVIGKEGPISLLPEGGEFYCDRMGQLFQGSVKIGELALYNIPGKNLIPAAGGFIIDPHSGATASPVESQSVVQSAREDSNYSTVESMVALIGISRQQEMAQQLLKAHDERASQSIRTFGGLA